VTWGDSQADATQIHAVRMADAEAGIRQRCEALSPLLDEQLLRRFAAAEAIAAGYGGVSLVSRITNIARSTINRGIDEINENRDAGHGRVRRVGGGRKSKISNDPALLDDLKALVEPATRGDPMQPLLWTSKSLRHLSAALKKICAVRRRMSRKNTWNSSAADITTCSTLERWNIFDFFDQTSS
jgi:hypothetical protein